MLLAPAAGTPGNLRAWEGSPVILDAATPFEAIARSCGVASTCASGAGSMGPALLGLLQPGLGGGLTGPGGACSLFGEGRQQQLVGQLGLAGVLLGSGGGTAAAAAAGWAAFLGAEAAGPAGATAANGDGVSALPAATAPGAGLGAGAHSAAGADGVASQDEVASLRAQLEAAKAQAVRWQGLHAQLQQVCVQHVVEQVQ